MTDASGPEWADLGGGVQGVTLAGADGNLVHLLKELWESKGAKHANLAGNWLAFVAAVEHADRVHLSRKDPDRRIYVKHFSRLVWEDGRTAPGDLMVVVDRTLDRVMTCFVPDYLLGKLGRQVWP